MQYTEETDRLLNVRLPQRSAYVTILGRYLRS
jgi:hypothetical protein